MDALARPWAEEMAHRMGAKGYEKSNPAGKLIMGDWSSTLSFSRQSKE